MKGGHLSKVNRLEKTTTKTDRKVSKAMQLLKRCHVIVLKNMKGYCKSEKHFTGLINKGLGPAYFRGKENGNLKRRKHSWEAKG